MITEKTQTVQSHQKLDSSVTKEAYSGYSSSFGSSAQADVLIRLRSNVEQLEELVSRLSFMTKEIRQIVKKR